MQPVYLSSVMNRPSAILAIEAARKRGGGEAYYGYSTSECESLWKIVRGMKDVSVYSEYDSHREYLHCTVFVKAEMKVEDH